MGISITQGKHPPSGGSTVGATAPLAASQTTDSESFLWMRNSWCQQYQEGQDSPSPSTVLVGTKEHLHGSKSSLYHIPQSSLFLWYFICTYLKLIIICYPLPLLIATLGDAGCQGVTVLSMVTFFTGCNSEHNLDETQPPQILVLRAE